MSINRSIAPDFHIIEKLHFPDYQEHVSKRGVSVYSLSAGTQEVVRLDLVFEAGLSKQIKNAQASFCSGMLSEGTEKHNARELAEALDYYGSYFQTRSNADDSVATLYCLEKHFTNCLPLFLEALIDSVFPEKELDIQKKNAIQKLLVSEKKNNYICRKNYYKILFGAAHPYAAFSEKQDIESIQKSDLLFFHQNNYLKGIKYSLLSGKFKDSTLQFLLNELDQTPFEKLGHSSALPEPVTQIGKHFIEKNDSVQSAIRIGKISIGRSHEDFRKLQFLNLIFGGYFGSRLMKNIREDKGLTYGIYSVLEPFKSVANWYIDSEINTKNREKALEEIYKEMARMRSEPVGNEELTIARNYYLGSFLRSLDGPFSIADRLKIMIDNSLPNSYYPDFVGVLNQIGSADIMEMANKYFSEENIVEMVVGKK